MAKGHVTPNEAMGLVGTIIILAILIGITYALSALNLGYGQFMGTAGMITGLLVGEGFAYLGITRDYGRYDVITGLIVFGYGIGLFVESEVPFGGAFIQLSTYGGILGQIAMLFVIIVILFGLYEIYSTVKMRRIG